MLRGSAWATRRDRELVTMEESRQRLAEREVKRARRRAEFAARIPVMAAEVAAEVKAAVTAEVTAAVIAALDAAFERRQEAIREALANALVRPRASSAVTSASSPSDLHALIQVASVTSERTMSVSAADSISIAVGAELALVAPTTCSTECPGEDNSATETAAASLASTTGIIPSARVVHDGSVRPTASCLQPKDMLADALPLSMVMLPTLPVHRSIARPSTDITLGPRMPTPATTKPAASAVLESDLRKLAPSTNCAVCLDPVSDTPVAVLTHDALDIMESSGAEALVSMLAPWGKPQGIDTVVMYKEEQLLFCLKDVSGDSVSLKLLELPLFQTKEENMSPPRRQLASAKVSWDTPMHQLQPKFNYSSGSCNTQERPCYKGNQIYWPWLIPLSSSIENALGKYFCPGVYTELLQYLFDSVGPYFQQYMEHCTACAPTYLALCAKQVDFEVFCLESVNIIQKNCQPHYLNVSELCYCNEIMSKGATDHGPGYFQWGIAVQKYSSLSGFLASLTSIVSKGWISCHILQGNTQYSELIQWSFNDALLQSDFEFHATGIILCYVFVQWEIPWIGVSQRSSFQDCSVGRELLCGSISLWEMSWSSLFDSLRVIQSRCELGSCIFWLWVAVLFFPLGIQTLKGPMEQWDPGIAKIYTAMNPAGGDIVTLYPSDVTSLFTSILSNVQDFEPYLASDSFPWEKISGAYVLVQPVLCPIRPEAHIRVSRPDDYNFSYVLVLGEECIPIQPTRDALHLPQAENTFWQASTVSHFIAYSSQMAYELLHWKITWPLYFVCSTWGNKSNKILHSTEVRCEGYLEKTNAPLQPFSTRTVQVFLLVNWSHTGKCDCQHLTSGTESIGPFQFLASIAMWIHSLEFSQGKLSWDSGIWAILFTQVEATRSGNVPVPAYYCFHCLDHPDYFDDVSGDPDYYLDVFHDQVPIGHEYYLGVFLEQLDDVRYLNLVKVCLDYDTHHDLGEIMKHQVPWDPGGSTWHWLEDKPKFKEGGMLATSFLLSLWAGPGAISTGPWASRAPLEPPTATYTRRLMMDKAAWNGTASASSAFCLPLPPVFLFLPL